jgi:hypothetical protein
MNTVALHLSAGDLRSAPAQAQRAHRQSCTHQSLSANKPRPPGRRAFHQDLRPHSRSRIKRARSLSARRSHGAQQSQYHLALFRESSRRLHAGATGCRTNLIVLFPHELDRFVNFFATKWNLPPSGTSCLSHLVRQFLRDRGPAVVSGDLGFFVDAILHPPQEWLFPGEGRRVYARILHTTNTFIVSMI